MKPHLVALVEQFWHKFPGGTAYATKMTLEALLELGVLDISGVAARHKSNTCPVDIPIGHSKLPRPLLYESWIRFNKPTIDSLFDYFDVVWASAMVVPSTSKPVVSTVHDLDFLSNPDRLSRRGKSFFPVAYDVVKKRSDFIVCPSEHVLRDCVDNGVEESKVKVVPWGVAAPIKPSSDAVRAFESLNLPDEYILWVGTQEPRKNLENLLLAVKNLPDVPLVIVGPDGWGEKLDSLIDKLGSRIIKLGFIDYSLLDVVYRNSRLFVFPSLAEGFGLPILEAMARGVPVVTSSGTATEEVAGGAAQLVDPNSVESIRYGISSCLGDSDLSTKLNKLGLNRAAEMTWQKTAKGYSETFLEFLE